MPQHLPQLPAGFVEVELHRSFRALQDRGDLAHGKLFDFIEDDGRALARREGGHGRVDFRADLPLLQGGAGRRSWLRVGRQTVMGNLHRVLQRGGHPRGISRAMGLDLIDRHLQKPPGKSVEILKPSQVPVQAHQAFHQDLIRVVVIAQKGKEKRVEIGLEKTAEFIESLVGRARTVGGHSGAATLKKLAGNGVKPHAAPVSFFLSGMAPIQTRPRAGKLGAPGAIRIFGGERSFQSIEAA